MLDNYGMGCCLAGSGKMIEQEDKKTKPFLQNFLFEGTPYVEKILK